MRVAIYCRDKPDSEPLRASVRDAHLAYVRSCGDTIRYGGPLLDATGTRMIGSLLIGEFDDLDAARDFCSNDPYARAELFESVQVNAMKEVFGALKDSV